MQATAGSAGSAGHRPAGRQRVGPAQPGHSLSASRAPSPTSVRPTPAVVPALAAEGAKSVPWRARNERGGCPLTPGRSLAAAWPAVLSAAHAPSARPGPVFALQSMRGGTKGSEGPGRAGPGGKVVSKRQVRRGRRRPARRAACRAIFVLDAIGRR